MVHCLFWLIYTLYGASAMHSVKLQRHIGDATVRDRTLGFTIRFVQTVCDITFTVLKSYFIGRYLAGGQDKVDHEVHSVGNKSGYTGGVRLGCWIFWGVYGNAYVAVGPRTGTGVVTGLGTSVWYGGAGVDTGGRGGLDNPVR